MRRIVRAALVLVLGLGLAGVAAGQEALSKRDATGVRLARVEERDAVETFGDLYRQYAAITPAWIPKLSSRQVGSPGKRLQR